MGVEKPPDERRIKEKDVVKNARQRRPRAERQVRLIKYLNALIGLQPLRRNEDLHVFPGQLPVFKYQIDYRLFIACFQRGDKRIVMIGGQQ